MDIPDKKKKKKRTFPQTLVLENCSLGLVRRTKIACWPGISVPSQALLSFQGPRFQSGSSFSFFSNSGYRNFLLCTGPMFPFLPIPIAMNVVKFPFPFNFHPVPLPPGSTPSKHPTKHHLKHYIHNISLYTGTF